MGLHFGGQSLGDEMLRRARQGDRDARDALLRDFMPFILRVASQVGGRYIRTGEDEEVSVGLLAFNEAIDAYVPGRGAFLSFAQTVITRRLIDHYRRRRKEPEVPLSELEHEEGADRPGPTVLDLAASAAWQVREADEARRAEIGELSSALAAFGIRFDDLPKHCPRHRDARERAIKLAAALAADPEMAQQLLATGVLPLAALAKATGATRKTLERHRRYIIAVALIFIHEWPELQSYLRPAAGEERGSRP